MLLAFGQGLAVVQKKKYKINKQNIVGWMMSSAKAKNKAG